MSSKNTFYFLGSVGLWFYMWSEERLKSAKGHLHIIIDKTVSMSSDSSHYTLTRAPGLKRGGGVRSLRASLDRLRTTLL